MKKIIDVYGRECFVDETNKKLLGFDNKTRKIRWNAQIIKNGELVGVFTDYIEDGVITDIKQKCESHSSPLQFQYAVMVKFDSSKNDPNKEIWNTLVDYVKNNQDKFFDSYGNFKKTIKTEFQKVLGKEMGGKAYDLAFNPNK